MAATKIRSKHALALGVICGACTGLVVLAYVLGGPSIFGRLGDAYRYLEWQQTAYLHKFGRHASLPEKVVFLPIDIRSTGLSEVPPELIAKSPALRLMADHGFPFPRATYAYVIERLVKAGAKVVAFDMRFPSASEDPAQDAAFARALAEYRDQVVIGSNLLEQEEDFGNRHSRKPYLELPSRTLIPNSQGDDPRLGFVNFRVELEDNKVRYAPFRTTLYEYFDDTSLEGQTELWSLAAQMARKAGFGDLVPAKHVSYPIRFLDKLQPLSLHEIFIDDVWQRAPYNNGALFKDKIVFIGPYGNWSKDELETPLGLMLGPQIHLSALASILNRDFLQYTSQRFDVIVILLAGVTAWLLGLAVANPVQRAVLMIAIGGAYVAIAFLLFNQSGLVLKLLSPNLVLLSGGFIGLGWETIVEQQERKRVRQTLERYVSKDVVQEVLDNPQSYINLTGVSRKPITILFSDVRGFTTLTEGGDAGLLVAQLNEYFTEMVRIVFAHLGTLDKFMGDAVVASWGAIVSRGAGPDAVRAVSAALDMLRSLRKLNEGWKQRGLGEFQIGLGVNHGDAICGNIGSIEKQEFTAIGDTVNTASRLEGATKQYHVDILIGKSTADLVRGELTVRSVDLLQVKGKTKGVEVFTVLDLREQKGARPAWLDAYEEGIRLYRQRSFEQAEACFASAAREMPDDWLCQEYVRRSRALMENPPAPDWDGVFVMTTK